MILPRWVLWVTNVDWQSVTGAWDPPSKWTPVLLQQARHFINAAQVSWSLYRGSAQCRLASLRRSLLEMVLHRKLHEDYSELLLTGASCVRKNSYWKRRNGILNLNCRCCWGTIFVLAPACSLLGSDCGPIDRLHALTYRSTVEMWQACGHPAFIACTAALIMPNTALACVCGQCTCFWTVLMTVICCIEVHGLFHRLSYTNLAALSGGNPATQYKRL